MSLVNENGGMVMPVSPMYGGNMGGGFGWGDGSFIWLFILFLFAFNGNGFGWGNNGGGGIVNNVDSSLQRGFDQQSVMGGLNGIQTGINGIQTSLCNGFAGVNAGVANGFAQAEIAANARQIADMNQSFANQSALTQGMNSIAMNLQNCCCENRAATADLKYTVATEACNDRAAVTAALQEVTTQNNANTQRILDKLSQQETEALKSQLAQANNQILMRDLASSQANQTAQLIADNAAQTQYVINRVAPYPVPSYPVANPYGYMAGNGCSCMA